jgi:hypothetical protein
MNSSVRRSLSVLGEESWCYQDEVQSEDDGRFKYQVTSLKVRCFMLLPVCHSGPNASDDKSQACDDDDALLSDVTSFSRTTTTLYHNGITSLKLALL